LVFWGTVIPLVIYLLVSIGGFLTCGDLCQDVIINRLTPLGFDDTLMDVCKLLLIVCLVVGNIIRNQSNKSSLFDLWEQYNLYCHEKNLQYFRRKIDELGLREKLHSAVAQETQDQEKPHRNTAQMKKVKAESLEDEVSFIRVVLPLQFVNCFIPAVTAILTKDNLIKYVASGTGFLAPIFMILYPCLITIRLHQTKVVQLSLLKYRLVWVYLIVATGFTYIALVINLITEDPRTKK
jgi:uncharacterized membrane protein YraQ (UPF0718 family)